MLKQKLKSLWQIIKKTIYPEYSCFVCNRELETPEDHICELCKKELVRFDNKVCMVCGEPIGEVDQFCDMCKLVRHPFLMARACFLYNDTSAKLVLGLKYNEKKYLVPYMAREMLLKLEDFGAMPDIVVPVPITEKRKKKRGFNQSELLADEMAIQSGNKFTVRTDLVLRSKDKPPQSRLTRNERLNNLHNVFALGKREDLTGKLVLIVDDVYTTGATVSEVSKILARLNPKAIIALTFAKTLL